MSGGAIAMMIFGAVLLWGGAAVTISIAMRKQKK
ncbi:MetS family NSS transporter small subunit [Chengkuizengella axinellae]|uniref:MetS family NSS transporter small subunit n=1 Tax=Chengkuizengella axinellae TaxID=3064388 RepID=A0ABT9IYP3_9BACL|nr:MetS family NSS transporter small subunit [Chengkuizengella sp. 2205SS18-9]MDP5274486.1 MetS family NSS transporter small subunit [Chengkuizengella sp. 2205SS18-9]